MKLIPQRLSPQAHGSQPQPLPASKERCQADNLARSSLPALRAAGRRSGIAWEAPSGPPPAAFSAAKARLENPAQSYPDYFKAPIHGYGNLGYVQAVDQEPAMTFFAKLAYAGDKRTPQALRSLLLCNHAQQLALNSGADYAQIRSIVDLGGGTGKSASILAAQFPQARITLLDLSAWYLAQAAISPLPHKDRIDFLHGNMESTALASGSVDAASCSFVIHEMPAAATTRMIYEVARILKPGGLFALMDDDPDSWFIRLCTKGAKPLQACMATLVGEPFIFEYYQLDVARTLREAGFIEVSEIKTGPRARTFIGRLPASGP